MASRVIRNFIGQSDTFHMREFSSVERGEQSYLIRSFEADEEQSVQDNLSASSDDEPDTIQTVVDEITDRDYLPPSKLAKAEDGVVGEAVEMLQPDTSHDGFVESDVFCDVIEEQEDYPKKVVKPVSADFAEFETQIEELKAQVLALEEEKKALTDELGQKSAALDAKSLEFDEANASIPIKEAEAKALGTEEGYQKGSVECLKKYEAEKADYISKIEDFNKESIKKLDDVSNIIKSIDTELSETVIGFVKSIIGTERKINDNFIVRLIKNNLERLNELKNVSFIVNPDDLEIVRAGLPDYNVSSDMSINKGSVLVRSKIGEISLDSKVMIDDLEKQINEELAAIKID